MTPTRQARAAGDRKPDTVQAPSNGDASCLPHPLYATSETFAACVQVVNYGIVLGPSSYCMIENRIVTCTVPFNQVNGYSVVRQACLWFVLLNDPY